MTDRIDELQRLHEAATKGPWEAGSYFVWAEDEHCVCAADTENQALIAAMRNALPALLRVARAAQQLRKAMTTPPKGYGDEHQGYWWTGATEKAAEEVAEAFAELERQEPH